MKNICILWHDTYPWDVRLEKFIDTLSEDYGIFVMCKGKLGHSEREEHGNLVIERVETGSTILNYPLFFNPFWKRKLSRLVKSNRINLIIVRDLPLMGLGIKIGRESNIPVIFDMAENYPAALVAYNKWYYKPFLLFNAFLPKYYEKYVISRSSSVLVVTQEQRDRLCLLLKDVNKISLVSNTPVLSEIVKMNFNNISNGEIRILYTGMIDIHRGVGTAIRAVSILIKRYPKIKLIIAGSGLELGRLQELTSSLGVEANIQFTGWVDHSKVYELIQNSHICLIPHLKSEHTDTTLPNKLFDYMAMGKPVISSDIKPVARILNQYHCGIVYKSGNSDSLAEKIDFLLRDANAAEFGKNGMKAVMDIYNWEIDSSRLKETIKKVI
jgi:glycosyltransferase involved in cell wall biosynthesis